MWIPLRGQIAWLSAIEISCFPVPRPLSFHLVTFYVQKQNSSLAEQPGWKWGRRQLGFQFRGSRGIPLRSHPKGGSFALKKTRELWFLKWIKKWTTERDNIRKLILSLAELANSQERSDDSSIVNNYYFVIKRRGTWKVQWPLSQITFMLQKHTHPLEKKKIAWHPGWLDVCLPPQLVAGSCCPVWYPFTLGGNGSCLFLYSWTGQVTSITLPYFVSF